VLETAVSAGYFDTTRQTSTRELADLLGCSAGTAHEHLRKGLAKLMESLFLLDTTPPGPSPATPGGKPSARRVARAPEIDEW
jgi:hypothetical protein